MNILCGEDADMKIADNSQLSPGQSDGGEAAAHEFIRQRGNGNVAKAKFLGATLAEGLAQFNVPSGDKALADQKKVLYSFVVNKVIEERSPNSILAQAALSSFYQTVQEDDPEASQIISDSVAFSLYILADRGRRNREQDTPGEVFADLCGMRGREETIYIGQSLFNQFYQDCAALYTQVEYED